MKQSNNIKELLSLDIDMIGLIFYSKSPRFVTDLDDEILLNSVPKVGVFVNETADNIERISQKFRLSYIQLHGAESRDLCRNLRQKGYKVIKNIAIKTKDDFFITQEYEGEVDYFLFDTKCENYGGSGKKFNWELLKYYKGNEDFLLSGGIKPEMAKVISQISHPKFKGIDINSQFEISAGIKNVEKIKEFINQIKLTTNE